MTGSALHSLRALVASLRTARIPAGADLRLADRVDCVVIIGSTCAGKTTMIEALRGSPLIAAGLIAVPRRYVTRARRLNDDDDENCHVDDAEFERMVAAGELVLHWRRPMDGGRELRYGFPPVAPELLPIYSGNNALYSNAASVRPVGALSRALVVGVYAPDEVRARRLHARSPDLVSLRAAEVAHRLADSSASIAPHAHVLIDNHGDGERLAAHELVALVERLVADDALRRP